MFSRTTQSGSRSFQDLLVESSAAPDAASATNATDAADTAGATDAGKPRDAAQTSAQPTASRTEPDTSSSLSPAPPDPMPRSAHAQRTIRESHGRTAQRGDGVSVIGRDLAIIGSGLRIVSRGKIQIEGEVRGDVYGDEVIIGDEGRVTGLVAASKVNVRGTVTGTIRSKDVVLHAASHVEGDLHHANLTLEQGAMFEGRSRRPEDPQTLVPDLDAAAEEEADGSDNVTEFANKRIVAAE